MTRERAKWMDQASFLTSGTAEAGKTVSAAHGFPGTRQNASVPTVPGGIWGMSVEITPALQPPKLSECLKKLKSRFQFSSARRSSAASLRLQLLHGCQRLS